MPSHTESEKLKNKRKRNPAKRFTRAAGRGRKKVAGPKRGVGVGVGLPERPLRRKGPTFE